MKNRAFGLLFICHLRTSTSRREGDGTKRRAGACSRFGDDRGRTRVHRFRDTCKYIVSPPGWRWKADSRTIIELSNKIDASNYPLGCFASEGRLQASRRALIVHTIAYEVYSYSNKTSQISRSAG
jgi:hypothetical protein